MNALITLLTDFGSADGYVGELKGRICSLVAGVTIVDISHDIASHDITGARLALARYWRSFPQGTVHLVVVDPGVGSTRAALAVTSDGYGLVGPDNGVLSPALLHRSAAAVELPLPSTASRTFHGRDVFAPAAARLALGDSISLLGELFPHPVISRTPEPHRLPDGRLLGEIIHIDRFGNAITNFIAPRGGTVTVGEQVIEIRGTYSDVEPGALVALTGSSGLVEIAVREGSAAALHTLTVGSSVLLQGIR